MSTPDNFNLPIPSDLSIHAATHFIAGLLYGLTTENHLEEIETCQCLGRELQHHHY